jgi:penicillin-binding protein 1A
MHRNRAQTAVPIGNALLNRPVYGPCGVDRRETTLGRRKSGARREPVRAAPAADDAKRGNSPKPRRRGGGSLLSRLAYWALVVGIWALLAGGGAIVLVASTLPPIQLLEVPKRPPTVEIVGYDGRPLTARGEMSGTDVPIKELPPYLPRAFIAIEDRRFYNHFGVDPVGLARAAVANVLHRGVSQGGSTITQQLAKNLFLTQQRTIWRKMQELVLALWLERKFSKTEILELYLNRVYFGAGAYGVEAAAQRYFGKPARQVKVAEAAMLAGLVKSPSRLAPNRNPQGAERRAKAVLAAMAELDFVTATMARSALAQPARAIKPAGAGSINYVADWIMDVLDDLVGRVDQDLVVETSIDPVLQAAAEKALIDELAAKGQKFDVSQGAVVAMSPDGAVRALVGGRNYNESQYNRAVVAKRQPGSAFKPFVYLTALERGLTPQTMREDKPVTLKGWKPENYSREYYGPVSLTQALALSLNTVPVRLTLEFGAGAVARTAHRLGITSKLEANPSLALGTSEVSLIELVSAYAPFANGGDAVAPHVIERVRNHAGKVLFARAPQNFGRIVEPHHVAMMNAMMRETLLIGTAQKAQLPGWPAAGKTGTSQDFRDAWFVGYTGHLVAGVWLGNDDSSPTKKATGGGLPVDIWSRLMKTGHHGVAVMNLPGLAHALASAGPPTPAPLPSPPPQATPAPAGAHHGARPAPIDNGMDGWFLDRLFGRR